MFIVLTLRHHKFLYILYTQLYNKYIPVLCYVIFRLLRPNYSKWDVIVKGIVKVANRIVIYALFPGLPVASENTSEENK